MKQLVISTLSLLLFTPALYSQQTGASKEESNTRSREVQLRSLEQRQNYHWKNGTTATPTGRAAAPTAMDGSYMSFKHVDAYLQVPSYQPELSRSTSFYLDKLDQRTNYHWSDGTTATPTGHEATATGGGYASLGQPRTDMPVRRSRPAPEPDSGNN